MLLADLFTLNLNIGSGFFTVAIDIGKSRALADLLPFSYSNVSEPTLKRSVLPASSSIAIAREPLDRPSRFGLTSTPQAFYVRR
jgi:hypothetical protein